MSFLFGWYIIQKGRMGFYFGVTQTETLFWVGVGNLLPIGPMRPASNSYAARQTPQIRCTFTRIIRAARDENHNSFSIAHHWVRV